MITPVIGTKGSAELTVSAKELAVNIGSGSLEVFATPVMTMLMEKAACNCIQQFLEGDETTVGTELSIKHTSATPEGMKVTAEAVLTEVNGRELIFDVSAADESGSVGCGTHHRFPVFGEKFTAKTKSKLK
ncbi:MAG: thioesterase family protein [Ruminococcus sp.]|nr:thioesterase family protein [Ruminococcus sp.]